MRLPRLILALPLVVLAPAAGAAPLDVRFEPPEIAAEPICAPRPTRATLRERWEGWDGATLPDRSTALIRRDLRLLRGMDPERWFETITQAQALLQERDESYDATDRKLDRIDLLAAAGRLGEVREAGLVEEIASAGGGSRRGQYAAGEMLLTGRGIEEDRARGLELIVAAAYAGHAGALLHLAEITSGGATVEGWDIAPELAVTLAFGALVGDLDPRICDRINRIGDEYARGDLVTRDADLADRWYRLSAALGDYNAAWEVAQLHLEAVGFEKDNDVLMAHLEQAAEGGLAGATLRLAKVLDRGALTEADPDRALKLFEEAAAGGDRAALIALVNALRDEARTDPDAEARMFAAYEQLAETKPVPAWALVRLGDHVLEEQGRWAGAAAARALYERALEAAPAHPIAGLRLARMDFRHADSKADFAAIADRLQMIVSIHGKTAPMDALEQALTCRAPDAPHLDRAGHWERMQTMADNLSLGMEPGPLRRFVESPTPRLIARVQQQALNNRPRSVALYAQLIAQGDAAGDADLLIREAHEAGRTPSLERARVRLALARTPKERSAALEALRRAAEEEGEAAELRLLRVLNDEGGNVGERRRLAERLSSHGRGLGLQTLADLDGGGEDARRATWDAYAEAVERNGDFEALAFALPFVAEDRRDDYLGRARMVMPCSVHSAITLSEANRRIGRMEEARHWADISEALSGGEGWKLVATADARLALGTEADTAHALDLLAEAEAAGDTLATMRLLSLHGEDGNGIGFEAERVAELYATLIRADRVDRVASALGWLDYADPTVQRRVRAEVDIDEAFREAARGGAAEAQLALARRIRREAEGPEQLSDYARWLTAAAEQGHPGAMLELSRAYALGLAVQPSQERSRAWLRRAADAGSEEAQADLRLLRLQQGTDTDGKDS